LNRERFQQYDIYNISLAVRRIKPVEEFIKKIITINDIEVLVLLKEEIKSKIIQPTYWTERIGLYYEVQLINQRIEEIEHPSPLELGYK
jgi:hypothetical protein